MLGKTFTKQGLAALSGLADDGARAAARRARPQGDPLDPGRPALTRARPVLVPAGHRQAGRVRDDLEAGAQDEAPRGRSSSCRPSGAPRRTRSSRSSPPTTSTPTTPPPTTRTPPSSARRHARCSSGPRSARPRWARTPKRNARYERAVELTDDALCRRSCTSASSVSSIARSNARCASAFAASEAARSRGPDEHLAGRRADLLGVRVVRAGAVGVEVVGGDDLDDLVLLGAPDRRQELRGREVLRLALLLRDRLVGDVLDDVLEERVLAALGRARVGLDREDLLADQRGEQRLELCLGQAGQRRQPRLGERLAEHGTVLDEPALLWRQAVEPGRDQARAASPAPRASPTGPVGR